MNDEIKNGLKRRMEEFSQGSLRKMAATAINTEERQEIISSCIAAEIALAEELLARGVVLPKVIAAIKKRHSHSLADEIVECVKDFLRK